MTDQATRRDRRPPVPDDLPRRSPWFFRGFRKYARRFVAKNFHAMRVDRLGTMAPPPAGPAVVVMNHASWWDPMTALVLSEGFGPDRAHYAPMDEGGVKQYQILERVGIFGIDLDTPRGGTTFLRRGSAILSRPDSVLWITPQGRFADVRERPARFRDGLGRLLHRSGPASILPLAVEYPFWNDRRPELLVRFGPWIDVHDGRTVAAEAWTRRLEEALVVAQDGLAATAQTRDPDRFVTIVKGSSGVGGIYDLGRRLRSAVRGERFHPEHQIHRPPGDPSS